MGAVKIDTYNHKLMNIADYSNKNHLKNLFKNYSNLEELSQCGDTVAASIFIDLREALDPANGIVTTLERTWMIMHYIDKLTMKEIASNFNRDTSAVHYRIESGIRRVQAALEGGQMYVR